MDIITDNCVLHEINVEKCIHMNLQMKNSHKIFSHKFNLKFFHINFIHFFYFTWNFIFYAGKYYTNQVLCM